MVWKVGMWIVVVFVPIVYLTGAGGLKSAREMEGGSQGSIRVRVMVVWRLSIGRPEGVSEVTYIS